jgi:transcriptional regulator with XRE-family HTH domain
MTITDIAFLTGSSKSMVCEWEQGKYFPQAQQLLRLSVIYRASPSELYEACVKEIQQEVSNRELVLFSND